MTQLQDMELEMVRYMHPNRGEHPVHGGATRKFYGNRKGGGTAEFLVHRADIAATPHYFHVVSSIPTPPTITINPPSAPELIGVPPPALINRIAPQIETLPPTFDTSLDDESRFDIQLLPGVTPAIRASLEQSRTDTPAAILAAGKEGLMELKHIGEVRATIIYQYVNDRFGQDEE